MSATATPPAKTSSRARMFHAIAEELSCAPELVGAVAAEGKLRRRSEIVDAVEARLAEHRATASAATPGAATNGGTRAPRPPREGSAMHAALNVLQDADEPLSPQEIYDRALERGLAGGLKGKTPVATLGAQLATANKRGLHVTRPAPGKYALRA